MKCGEGLSNTVSNIIRSYNDHMKFAAFIIVYMVVCLVCFCLILLSYVFLLLRLCILIVMYVLFCIFCFHSANWHSLATLTEVFLCFCSVVRKIPGYNSQRRGTAHTLPTR